MGALAAGVLVVVAVVGGVLLFAGDGDDEASLPEPRPVDSAAAASIQESLDALGEPAGDTERDQMRSQLGPPDGFSISEYVDEDGNITRREQWFYYEIRTVFEYSDGRLVANLPIQSSYGDFLYRPH